MSRMAPPVSCAARRCGAIVERGELMCKGHWFSLPQPLRSDVWRAWRRLQNWRGRADAASMSAMIAGYREAVRAAVDYLDGVPPTPAAAMAVTAFDDAGQPISYDQGRML